MNHQRAIEHYNNGLQHAKDGNWDEAMEFFSKAIAENPQHVNSYNVLGKVYVQKGKVGAARRCWRKALRIDPDNTTARQCLTETGGGFGQIQVRKLLWPAVVATFLVALIISNSVLLRRIGDLEAKLTTDTTDQETRQNGAANPTEENSIHGQPKKLPQLDTDSQVTEAYNQALADCRSGDYDQAMEVFRQVLEYPQPHQLKDNAQYWLAECYYAQKNYTRALEEFQKVKVLFPKGNKVFDAELKVVYSYYKLNRMEEARKQFLQLSKDWPQQQYQSRMAPLSEEIRLGQTH